MHKFIIEEKGEFDSFINVINGIHYGKNIFSIGESKKLFRKLYNNDDDILVNQMSSILFETYVIDYINEKIYILLPFFFHYTLD